MLPQWRIDSGVLSAYVHIAAPGLRAPCNVTRSRTRVEVTDLHALLRLAVDDLGVMTSTRRQ